MRKIILGLVAATAIATPLVAATAANATVAVDNGIGFVGKGDIQTALGYKNDAAIQADAANIKFASTGTVTEVGGFQWTCNDGTTQRGYVSTTVSAMTQTVNATPIANGQGKITNGFNLTGVNTDGVKGAVLSSTTDTGLGFGVCPNGYRTDSVGFFADAPVVTAGGLTVSNGVKTVSLPNTPVAIPVV